MLNMLNLIQSAVCWGEETGDYLFSFCSVTLSIWVKLPWNISRPDTSFYRMVLVNNIG